MSKNKQIKKIKIIVSFIVGLILMTIITLLFLYQHKSNKEEQNNNYRLTKEEKAILQQGDIILRHGFGIISDAIVKYTKSDYPVSHCGIIVKDTSGQWAVIHTVSNTLVEVDGMQKDNLDLFVKGSHLNSLVITRYMYENDTLHKNIAERANYYLSQQIPFDHKFDCTDSTKFFCTEFIWKVFKTAIDVDLYESQADEKELNCMNFDAFTSPTKFMIILNHNK